MTNKITIIGHGRFGKTLNKILSEDFSVNIYDSSGSSSTLDEALKAKIIFMAVPIRYFEKAIKQIAPKISRDTTLIDVCSVKVYPVEIMKKYLPASVGIIATHPLFGPDSIKNKYPLKIMMSNVRDTQKQYSFWKNYFVDKKIEVIEMSPEEHDELAAKSQGITHFIGRSLERLKAHATDIDTAGYSALLEVMQQTCHDSEELFFDLQRYNPYTDKIIKHFETAVIDLRKKILSGD